MRSFAVNLRAIAEYFLPVRRVVGCVSRTIERRNGFHVRSAVALLERVSGRAAQRLSQFPNDLLESVCSGEHMLRQASAEIALQACEQLDAFQAPQPEIPVEVSGRAEGRDRMLLAQLCEEVARNLENARLDVEWPISRIGLATEVTWG